MAGLMSGVAGIVFSGSIEIDSIFFNARVFFLGKMFVVTGQEKVSGFMTGEMLMDGKVCMEKVLHLFSRNLVILMTLRIILAGL